MPNMAKLVNDDVFEHILRRQREQTIEIQISFCSSQCKNKKKGIIPYPVDEKLYFVMPPRATGALSFYEFV